MIYDSAVAYLFRITLVYCHIQVNRIHFVWMKVWVIGEMNTEQTMKTRAHYLKQLRPAFKRITSWRLDLVSCSKDDRRTLLAKLISFIHAHAGRCSFAEQVHCIVDLFGCTCENIQFPPYKPSSQLGSPCSTRRCVVAIKDIVCMSSSGVNLIHRSAGSQPIWWLHVLSI